MRSWVTTNCPEQDFDHVILDVASEAIREMPFTLYMIEGYL
jgi:hypothetical protein